MAIKIGITGGIGSGKSVVAKILKTMGIPVYQTDDEAKRLMREDCNIRQELIALLGAGVYLCDGNINRPYLASYLFANEAHAQQINTIVHPRVKTDFLRWAEQFQSYPVVALESAILIEAGFTDAVDRVVMVHAPLGLRIQRVMQRDQATETEVRNRMERQMSDEEKLRQAQFVITNDEIQPLLPQITALLKQLEQ